MSAEDPTDPTDDSQPSVDLTQKPGESDVAPGDATARDPDRSGDPSDGPDDEPSPDDVQADEPPPEEAQADDPDAQDDDPPEEAQTDDPPAAAHAEHPQPGPDDPPAAAHATHPQPGPDDPSPHAGADEPPLDEAQPRPDDPSTLADEPPPDEGHPEASDLSEATRTDEPPSDQARPESDEQRPAGVDADPPDPDDPVDPVDPDDPLAAMLAELDAPRRPAPAGVQLSDELPIDPEDDLRGVEGEASLRLVSILESLLFAAARPLKVQDLRKILAETSKHQIQLALAHLMAVTRDRGVMLAQVAGGFQFRTHPENAVWVQKMLQAKPARLSRTQIETLAIVAYRQPITRPEIDDVRGVDSGAVLKGLLERELVQIVGKKEEPGRPLLYGTTVKFLEFFNLRGLRDLPTLRDFRDLSEESKATLRTQLGASEAEALGQGVLDFPAAAAHDPTADTQPELDASNTPAAEDEPANDEQPEPAAEEGPADMQQPEHATQNTPPESEPTPLEAPPSSPEPGSEPTPMEAPGDPSPDELVPPAPERLPGTGPDEIRPPDPGTDSPDTPDEWQAPGPDIADVPGVDPGQGEPSET